MTVVDDGHDHSKAEAEHTTTSSSVSIVKEAASRNNQQPAPIRSEHFLYNQNEAMSIELPSLKPPNEEKTGDRHVYKLKNCTLAVKMITNHDFGKLVKYTDGSIPSSVTPTITTSVKNGDDDTQHPSPPNK